MFKASPICRSWCLQPALWAWAFARESAGNSSAASIPMMAMTTKSSMRVKALESLAGFLLEVVIIGSFLFSGELEQAY
jgi:hypothetical protein